MLLPQVSSHCCAPSKTVQEMSLCKLCTCVRSLSLSLLSPIQAVYCNNATQAVVLQIVESHLNSRTYMPEVQADSSTFLSSQEKGNNNAQWWQAQVMSTLGSDRWMRVGLRQLSGMLVMVFALSSLSVRSWSHAQLPSCSCNKGCIMPACCCTSNMHDAVQHTFSSCNNGCILPVCCSASNMHGAMHGPSPDVTLHRHCVTHLLYCGKTPGAAFPRGQCGRPRSKLTSSLDAAPIC